MAITVVTPDNLEYFKTKQDAANVSKFASKSHTHSASDIASGTLPLGVLPSIPTSKISGLSLSTFGVTATAAELNKLDGVTATATELNYTDGVTSNIQTQLNNKAASSHTHGASSITGLTANRALVSNSSGNPAVSAVTSTELGYLDGVTSNVQTQLNGKAASSHTHSIANVSGLQTALDGKAASSHTHAATQITGLTASRALVSDTSGRPAVSSVTSTELGYLDGVTSAIQTQLNGKAASSHTHAATSITGLTTNRALVSNGSGQVGVSPITTTELGYLDGVTSNIQTQLNSIRDSVSPNAILFNPNTGLSNYTAYFSNCIEACGVVHVHLGVILSKATNWGSDELSLGTISSRYRPSSEVTIYRGITIFTSTGATYTRNAKIKTNGVVRFVNVSADTPNVTEAVLDGFYRI